MDDGRQADGSGAGAVLVVDAANVVGARADGWWKDRAGAATRLLTDLVPLTAAAPGECGSGTRDDAGPWGEVVVVLEGAARRADDTQATGITVVRAEASGDDCVVEQVRAREGLDVVVVTSDQGLRRRVQDHGAQVRGARWVLDLVAGTR